jgi:hypothetical protein
MGLVKSTYRPNLELCKEKDITYLTEREIKGPSWLGYFWSDIRSGNKAFSFWAWCIST